MKWLTYSKAESFFGVIQRIYVLFSSSTQRWKISKDNVSDCTVKSLSQTLWESHVKSVKSMRYQALKIRAVLIMLANNASSDNRTKSEVESIVEQNEKFEFLLGLCIW